MLCNDIFLACRRSVGYYHLIPCPCYGNRIHR